MASRELVEAFCESFAKNLDDTQHFTMLLFTARPEPDPIGDAVYDVTIWGSGIPRELARVLRDMAEDLDKLTEPEDRPH